MTAQVAEKLCLQAAQKDLRGEAIERNEAYKSFSTAGKSRNLDKNI